PPRSIWRRSRASPDPGGRRRYRPSTPYRPGYRTGTAWLATPPASSSSPTRGTLRANGQASGASRFLHRFSMSFSAAGGASSNSFRLASVLILAPLDRIAIQVMCGGSFATMNADRRLLLVRAQEGGEAVTIRAVAVLLGVRVAADFGLNLLPLGAF